MEYVKCPYCDLNYIPKEAEYCDVCNPKMRNKLISDMEEAYEAYRESRQKAYKLYRQSMEDYYAYRWNRKPKY